MGVTIKGDHDYFGLKIRERDLNYIAKLPVKTYFMDDQRRSLSETVLLSTLNICFKFSWISQEKVGLSIYVPFCAIVPF